MYNTHILKFLPCDSSWSDGSQISLDGKSHN